MGLQIVTPPIDMPVTLDEAKAQLNVVDADDDDLITELILAATAALDGPFGWLGRAIMPQTWDYFRDSFPSSTGSSWPTTSSNCGCATTTNCGGIEIPLPPLIQVDSISYSDPDNPTSYLTLASTEYAVDNSGYVGWIEAISDWPTPATGINAVRIRFQAGYVAPNSLPVSVKHAILLMIRDFYDQRGSYVTGTVMSQLPRTVDALIMPYKVYPL